MNPNDITRAELLEAIRRVQDLAIELGLDARIGLHADGESLPSAFGNLQRERDFKVTRLDGTVSDCTSYAFAERLSGGRHDVTIILRRTSKTEAA